MISVFYTGDRRHNPKIAEENHGKFFDKLRLLDEVEIHYFTKDYINRGVCPFDEGGPDVKLRRGQGGAVQVWDFCQSVDRVSGDVIIRLRTDIWFTESSIKHIINHVTDILNDQRDIVFFGSDLVNDNQGKEHEVIEIDRYDPARIQDFIVVARRKNLVPSATVIKGLLSTSPKKVRSGNKTFRTIVPEGSRAATVLCHLWLVRKHYDTMPTNHQVCGDYIYSYVEDGKNVNDILAPAIDWWKSWQ